jgi:hypothetical protein
MSRFFVNRNSFIFLDLHVLSHIGFMNSTRGTVSNGKISKSHYIRDRQHVIQHCRFLILLTALESRTSRVLSIILLGPFVALIYRKGDLQYLCCNEHITKKRIRSSRRGWVFACCFVRRTRQSLCRPSGGGFAGPPTEPIIYGPRTTPIEV